MLGTTLRFSKGRRPPSTFRNELTELAASRRHGVSARGHRGVLFEQPLVLVHDHVGARAGRDDDGARRAFEHADRVARNLARFGVESRVERRLAAAGLIRRDFDIASEPLEHANGRHRDLGGHLVDQAGVKQLDRHTVGTGVEPAVLDV